MGNDTNTHLLPGNYKKLFLLFSGNLLAVRCNIASILSCVYKAAQPCIDGQQPYVTAKVL